MRSWRKRMVLTGAAVMVMMSFAAVPAMAKGNTEGDVNSGGNGGTSIIL